MPTQKLLFSALALFAFAGAMSAQDLFTWSYQTQNIGDTSSPDSAAGTLIATETNPSQFQWTVDSISGNWTSPGGGGAVTGLITGYGNNNLFYYGSNPTFSSLGNGIGFTTSANSNVVVFNNGDEVIYTSSGSPISTTGYNTSAISPNGYQFTEIGPATSAPWEPSDAIFISGAIAFGCMQYRRMRRKLAS